MSSSFYEDASLVMIPSGYKTSKVYSAKPTDGAGDLDFTRSNDTATRVNSAGLIEKVRTNLSLYSEQFDNASWLKGTLTVTANAGTAPNGTTTADLIYPSANSSNSVIFNGVTIANSTEYTNSIYVKASGKTWTFIRGINDGNGVYFDVANGVKGTTTGADVSGTISSVGSGWYRCSVTQTSTSTTGRLVVLVVDGNGSTAVTANGTDGLLIWAGQTETGVMTDYIATTSAAVSVGPVANVPRLDYLNSSCPRLLLEPQRTNLALWSENFDNAYWTKVGTVSANAGTSPDGYVNADKLAAGTSNYISRSITTTIGQAYTASVYIKSANAGQSASLRFNFSAGQPIPAASVQVDTMDEWQRVSATFTATTTLTIMQIGEWSTFGYGPTEDILIWGAQIEAGAYATSYIPTLGAAVTRGADVASKTGISSLIGQTQGTIVLDVENNESEINSFITLSPSATTLNNHIYLGQNAGNLALYVRNGGTYSIIAASITSISGIKKVALAYGPSFARIYVNGAQVYNSTAAVIPSGMDKIEINSFNTSSDIGRVSVGEALIFKAILPDADLAALTA